MVDFNDEDFTDYEENPELIATSNHIKTANRRN